VWFDALGWAHAECREEPCTVHQAGKLLSEAGRRHPFNRAPSRWADPHSRPAAIASCCTLDNHCAGRPLPGVRLGTLTTWQAAVANLPCRCVAGRMPSGWACSSAASPACTAAPRTACTAGGPPPAPQPSASRPAPSQVQTQCCASVVLSLTPYAAHTSSEQPYTCKTFEMQLKLPHRMMLRLPCIDHPMTLPTKWLARAKRR